MLQNEIKIKQNANFGNEGLECILNSYKTMVYVFCGENISRKMLDFIVYLVLLTQNAMRDGRENVTSHTVHH